jgi:ABC-type cobalt transport system substrate-binding protein
MFLGACLALLLCNAKDIIRPDNTKVVLMKNPTWQTEMFGLWETLKYEPFVILLFPMFWCSNWFYTYQQNAVNAARFDVRTRALNGLLYYAAQIVGALILGYALDISKWRRSVRAKSCLAMLYVTTMAIWGGGYAWQNYTRFDVDHTLNKDGSAVNPNALPALDWTSHGYVGPMFLYFFYGLYDSLWQASVYWYILNPAHITFLISVLILNRFMGALSNSGRRSANYVGFYKGIQSAGAAVMWSRDSHKMTFKAEFLSNWILLMVALVCATPIIWLKIHDTVILEEDLKGTDETAQDVILDYHVKNAGEA